MKKEFERIKTEIKYSSVLECIPKQEDINFLNYFGQLICEINLEKTDYKQALKILKLCQSAFILSMNKSLSEIEIQDCFVQYIKFLNDMPYCYLIEAIEEIIKNQKFFPTIAEIIEKTGKVASDYNSISCDAGKLVQELEIRLMPRTKQFLQTILEKKSDERSSKEIYYLTFMREHYSNLFR